MASQCFIVFVVVYSIIVIGANSLLLKFTPEKCAAGLDDVVEIACLPDKYDGTRKEIMVLEISRNNQPPIAVLRHSSNISYGHEAKSQFQAEGSIGQAFGQSFLNLSLWNPKSEDTGVYTCTMYYLDETFQMKDHSVSGNLVVEKLDVKIIETVLDSLKERTTALEDKEETLNLKLDQVNQSKTDGIEELMKRVASLEQKQDTLANMVTSSSAFSAAMNNSPVVKGKAIVFPRVITRVGKGYNPETGVFTAPWQGLYAFQLTAMTNGGGKAVWIAIKSNSTVLAKLRAGNNNSQDQSSISCIVRLEAGQAVRAEVLQIGGQLYTDHYTLFSGHLVQLL